MVKIKACLVRIYNLNTYLIYYYKIFPSINNNYSVKTLVIIYCVYYKNQISIKLCFGYYF